MSADIKNIAFKYLDIALKIMNGCMCDSITSAISFGFKNHEFENNGEGSRLVLCYWLVSDS